jgi:hypothetical protein
MTIFSSSANNFGCRPSKENAAGRKKKKPKKKKPPKVQSDSDGDEGAIKAVPNPTLGGLLGATSPVIETASPVLETTSPVLETTSPVLETTSPEPEKVSLAEDLDFSLSSSDNEAGSSNQASLESINLSEGECSGSDD